MNKQGLLLCARYSVAPNFFGYCGPDKNSSLVDHLREDIVDREVPSILSEFDTLYFYLKLISIKNKIAEPFDKRVVEAYWLGNALLHNISSLDYADFLKEKFLVHKKIDYKNYLQIKGKILTNQFLPHHSFHVFNIFRRTGFDPSMHGLRTMDECRIGYGKVIKSSKCKVQNYITAKTKPLMIKTGKLTFGSSIVKEFKLDYKGKTFLRDLRVGDWVSFHWGFVCDVLDQRQVRNLEYYTKKAIDFYNM